MPDIAMCQNEECPSSSKCYRFTAVPFEHWQSWMDFKPVFDTDRCESFMSNR